MYCMKDHEVSPKPTVPPIIHILIFELYGLYPSVYIFEYLLFFETLNECFKFFITVQDIPIWSDAKLGIVTIVLIDC